VLLWAVLDGRNKLRVCEKSNEINEEKINNAIKSNRAFQWDRMQAESFRELFTMKRLSAQVIFFNSDSTEMNIFVWRKSDETNIVWSNETCFEILVLVREVGSLLKCFQWWRDSSQEFWWFDSHLMIRVSHFYKISKHLIDKRSLFAHKKMSFFASILTQIFCFDCVS